MKILESKIVEWFLRLAISAGFLSAVADRLGYYPKAISVWGNWENFIAYTKTLNPYFSDGLIPVLGYTATILEIIFGILLLIPYKTTWVAKGSGFLVLLFAFAMITSIGFKAPLDYSVFCVAGAAFALSILTKESK